MWFTLEDVVGVTNATVAKTVHTRFRGVAIDSRVCEEGQLFVALRGKRVDGHSFVGEAIQRGAFGALVEQVVGDHEATLLFVPNTYEALTALGRYASFRLQGTKIGITGTAGKTTCKHLFAQLLGTRFSVGMTPQSFNTALGVSVSLANLEEDTTFIVVEAGISERGEMGVLASLIHPEVVVFTTFGQGHLEGLGSLQGVVEEKLKLLGEHTGLVYLNVDQELVSSEDVCSRVPGARVIPFGRGRNAFLRLESFALDVDRLTSTFTVFWEKHCFLFEAPVLAPQVALLALPGIHYALEAGVPLEDIRAVLADFRELPGRGGFFRFQNGVVIDDTYNANPVSVRKAIDLATSFARGGYRVCLVLGDMLELGEEAERAHEEVLCYLRGSPVDRVLLFGPLFARAFARVQDVRFTPVGEPEEAHALLREFVARSGRWMVLLKGSRGMQLETMMLEEWREGDA